MWARNKESGRVGAPLRLRLMIHGD